MRSSGPVVGRRWMFLLLFASSARASPPATDGAPKPPPAELQQRVAQAMKSDEEPLSREECQALTGHARPLEECSLTAVAGGKAALLQLTTECGGDSCDVQVFVYRPGQPVLRLPDSSKGGSLTGGHLVMTPSLEHVITDWVGLGPRDMGDWRVELYRIELRTGKASPWVKGCFSPALSPGGRWILCRNRRGDVLKVPLTGGTPTLVHRGGLSAEQVSWTPYAYLYPDAVTFPSPGRMRVTTSVVAGEDGETQRTQELPWRE
ncbi:hypothetical protein KYC5002_25720 [Archangium violaceum]|uniref:hypothetical protein n=1 Tax=Archangium violaceum TaxID=83451 RepID=UPI002B2987C1|nr:hypothetical protein KYC5002_25720 [Archangium gephyra]